MTIAINSGGGNVDNGAAIYNLLLSMPFEIVTHDIGNVNSAAILMFLGGKLRLSNTGCYFGFHGGGIDLSKAGILNQSSLELNLEALRARNNRMIDIIADRMGRLPDDCRYLFKGETLVSPEMAVESGLISNITAFQALPNADVKIHV